MLNFKKILITELYTISKKIDMGKNMSPATNYDVVSVPKNVMNKVKEILKTEKVTGYRNPTEFVLDCIRRRLEEIEKRERNDIEDIKAIVNKVFEEYNNKY